MRVGILAAAFSFCLLFAESFDERHRRESAANPGDVQFRLATAGGVTAFHRGERIPLVLEFSSRSTNKYKLDTTTHDRSGRLMTEEFILDRADAADPYSDYYATAVLGGISGGARGSTVLGPEPARVELKLNDWFRFDAAGTYRLFLKSHRLTRQSNPGESEDSTVKFAAVSNVLEIRIKPDDGAWTASKLAAIQATLATREPRKPGGDPSLEPTPDARWIEAMQDLRYLATPAAVETALGDAVRTATTPDTLTLVGARDRGHAVAAYDRYLADPGVRLRSWDIRLRALLTFIEAGSPHRLPMFVWQIPDSGDAIAKLQADARDNQSRFDPIARAEAVRLIPTVRTKNEAVRVESGEAIASIAPQEAEAAGLVPAYDYGMSREELIARFTTFPEKQQSEILGEKWDLVRGPEMIPVLRAVAAGRKAEGLAKYAGHLAVWGGGVHVGDAALRRLTELAPEQARRFIADDLAAGNARYSGFAVREVEAGEIPEAAAVFARWLAAQEQGALPLLAKFGGADLAAGMQAFHDSRRWACAEAEWFMVYFARHPPAFGKLPAPLGCHRLSLLSLARTIWSPALEQVALRELNAADPEVAGSAAMALGRYGSAAVEPFLWKRLEGWSERWRGRTAELDVHPITGGTPLQDRKLGDDLFRAIAAAKSWILDEPRRKRLLGFCIDEHCRKSWERPRAHIHHVEAVNGGSLYPPAFRVDGYEAPALRLLEEKLRQYPEGSKFRWCPQAFNPMDHFSKGQRDDMFKRLAVVLNERAMALEPYSESKCNRWGE